MSENNPSIESTTTTDHTIVQKDIPFVCQVMVPIKDPKQKKVQQFRKSDPFLEPFEEGICIDDNLTKSHRLIFNKYPARKNHLLVITKEKEA